MNTQTSHSDSAAGAASGDCFGGKAQLQLGCDPTGARSASGGSPVLDVGQIHPLHTPHASLDVTSMRGMQGETLLLRRLTHCRCIQGETRGSWDSGCDYRKAGTAALLG
jgi:hypothetical protein